MINGHYVSVSNIPYGAGLLALLYLGVVAMPAGEEQAMLNGEHKAAFRIEDTAVADRPCFPSSRDGNCRLSAKSG